MKHLILLAVFALTACGADGAPEKPQTGVAITGEARVGVTGSL
ncbi:hypothetical protein [Paragemmobacter straminiformis]|nr:hypothetical protein [Gemmobacter straminiformis]